MLGQQAITRDFSKKRLPIYFTIDEHRFDCHRALPLESIAKLLSLSKGMTGGDDSDVDENDPTRFIKIFDRISPIVKVLLKKESYRRFMARFKPELDDEGDIINEEDWEPIDHFQLMEVIKWVTEIYTKDPTSSLPDSSSGSTIDESGSASTAGVPLEASTLEIVIANASSVL